MNRGGKRTDRFTRRERNKRQEKVAAATPVANTPASPAWDDIKHLRMEVPIPLTRAHWLFLTPIFLA